MENVSVITQLAEALEHALLAGIGGTEAKVHHHEGGVMAWRCGLSAKEARLALDRHRAEPEGPHVCRYDGDYSDCPCYQEGLEAQRERVG